MNLTSLPTHPSLITARSLLLTLLSNPMTFPLPRFPPLSPPHQHLILIALSHFSPPTISDHFQSQQLKSLPPNESKILLEYQSSPIADPRLVLFPIAILRAHIVSFFRKGLPFDITSFINSTFLHARIFGVPLDPDAWELPGEYWDEWGGWFPQGREYCHSLGRWRRRDGHVGSTLLEMILGFEKRGSRREDAVGRPPGWTF